MNLPYVSLSIIIWGLILAYSWRAYVRNITKYWKVRKVEYVKPQPLFGNFLNMLVGQENFVINVKRLYDAINGPFGGIYLFTRPVLMVRDPEFIKRIITGGTNNFTRCEYLTNNLLVLKESYWSGGQNLIPIPFLDNMHKRMFDVIKKRCTALQEHVERESKLSSVLDMRELINQLTTATTASFLYSNEIDSFHKHQDPMWKIGRLIANSRIGQLRSLLAMTLPSVVSYFDIGTMDPELQKIFHEITEVSLKLRDSKKFVHFDYMQILAQRRNTGDKLSEDGKWESKGNNNKHLTIDEVVAHAFNIFAFVYQTASSIALFALMELAKNYQIQRKLQTEIDQAIKNSKDLTKDAIQNMKYLDQVCNETLRKYPVIPIIVRSVAKRFKLTDTDIVLDENQLVFVPIYALHHDSKYYVRPDEFNPNRFSSDEIKKRAPDTFYPYGNNFRNYWVSYTTLHSKMSIVAICSKFDLDLAPDRDVPGNGGDNFNLRITRRK